MEKKVTTDLSKLSNLPEDTLDKLFSLCSDIIGNSVYETILSSEDITEFNFGFGKLIVKADLKEIKMKFVPSKELEADLKNINNGGQPSLKHKLEKAAVAKLIDMYKEII